LIFYIENPCFAIQYKQKTVLFVLHLVMPFCKGASYNDYRPETVLISHLLIK